MKCSEASQEPPNSTLAKKYQKLPGHHFTGIFSTDRGCRFRRVHGQGKRLPFLRASSQSVRMKIAAVMKVNGSQVTMKTQKSPLITILLESVSKTKKFIPYTD
jgi:hypothetical protein